MHIDNTTFSDLDVFGSEDGPGLFALVDHTATAAGQRALRRRFQSPASSADTIRSTQAGVRFFQSHQDAFRIEAAAGAVVAKYLRSNITNETTSALRARLDFAWMKLRYRDVASELEAGVEATISLCAQIFRLCKRLREADPPREVASLVAELSEIAEGVLATRAGSRELLLIDSRIRGEQRARLDRGISLLGELDALNSMAITTSSLGWVIPEVLDDDEFRLEATGVWHPFVEGAVRKGATAQGG